MVAAAERFGFNTTPRMPAAKPSVFPEDLKDSLAVGAASIGQDRVLATPVQMAAVGATIANRGVYAAPRIVRSDLPGVAVAGKTGTAELHPTASGPQDPKNTDARVRVPQR